MRALSLVDLNLLPYVYIPCSTRNPPYAQLHQAWNIYMLDESPPAHLLQHIPRVPQMSWGTRVRTTDGFQVPISRYRLSLQTLIINTVSACMRSSFRVSLHRLLCVQNSDVAARQFGQTSLARVMDKLELQRTYFIAGNFSCSHNPCRTRIVLQND